MTSTAEPTPPENSPAEDLVAAARAGETGAWDALHARYARLVVASVRRAGMTGTAGDDVVQETWLRLVENIGRIRDDRAIASWLVRTATRATWDAQRRSRREQPATDAVLDLRTPAQPDPSEEVHRRLAAQSLARCLPRLTARERALVQTLLADPPSYREISARLGIPIGSIGPVRGRAIARLRALMQVDPLLEN